MYAVALIDDEELNGDGKVKRGYESTEDVARARKRRLLREFTKVLYPLTAPAALVGKDSCLMKSSQ